jgi:hypothetical protein
LNRKLSSSDCFVACWLIGAALLIGGTYFENEKTSKKRLQAQRLLRVLDIIAIPERMIEKASQ